MRFVREFKGFAGIRLESDDIGTADDPSIVLLHGIGQTRQVWEEAAVALRAAGRHVINIDLRGHGGSEWPEDGRYDFSAYVEDLRAVLAQMRTRPVVVAATLAGWVATAALAEDATTLAAGLVLVDLPASDDPNTSRATTDKLRSHAAEGLGKPDYDVQLLDRFDTSGVLGQLVEVAPQLNIPVLFVRGALDTLAAGEQTAAFVSQLPNVEAVEVEDAGLLVVDERNDAFNALLLDFLERKQPRFVPDFREGSDARTFRDALGCFATGVTIITAMGPDGKPIGLTANSFTSVSLDPPLLLVCIANGASSAPILQHAERFAVNVLQIGQQPTSNRFAGKGEDRFANTPWDVGEFGTPVLTGSLSSFECERDAVHDGGDHFILVGRVLKAMFEPRRDPLLYFRGKYRRLHFA
jgi:flavin reductase (DIM6/NTAB) family NADH-FMN oxidoreductase RutF/pimeloyl-ACP methyl ester carboxylesterase